VSRNDRVDIVRYQGFPSTIVIVAIAVIKRHLKIVNHYNCIPANGEHDGEFFGKRKIVVPMRIQIDKEILVARPAEGPVKQQSERCTTVPAQKMDITSPAKPGPGKAVVARITFDGKYWQSRRGQELSPCK